MVILWGRYKSSLSIGNYVPKYYGFGWEGKKKGKKMSDVLAFGQCKRGCGWMEGPSLHPKVSPFGGRRE